MIRSIFRAALLLPGLWSGGSMAAESPETVVLTVDNVSAVQSGPSVASAFTLGRPWRVTSVTTYHWNGGSGATPGTVALREAGGTLYGPWSTVGRSGQGGAPNVYWDASPDTILPAGEYTVVDSDPATWSHNAASGHRGFVTVKGRLEWDVPGGGSATVGAVLYSIDGDLRTAPVVWTATAPAETVEAVLSVPTADWSPGIHRLTFAAQGGPTDETGPWATAFVRRIDAGASMDRVAMAVDCDPVDQAAAAVEIEPSAGLWEGALALPAGNAAAGLHNLWMRCRVAGGNWGPLLIAPLIGEVVEPLATGSEIAGFELRVIDGSGVLQAGPFVENVAPAASFDGTVEWPALRTRTGGDHRMLAAATAVNGLVGPWAEAAYRQSVTPFGAAMNALYWPPEAFPGVDVAFGGDANADGVANGLAFFHGLGANLPAWARSVRVTEVGDALIVRFRERAGGFGTPGIDYAVDGVWAVLETSPDLGHTWAPAGGTASLDGVPAPEGDGTETVAVRISKPVTGRQIFIRLRLELLTEET